MTARPYLDHLREQASQCHACPLWKDATQTVFGEGPLTARIMLVGEQPGDKEDLAGRPFVGPAGQVLDRALAQAGLDRRQLYVTNAVKHFKFFPRGKFRLHQKPVSPEIRACRPWYEQDLDGGTKALVTVHPSYLLRLPDEAAQRHEFERFVDDLKIAENFLEKAARAA